jgi:tyrosine-protein kinase Etk/Wzc
VDNRIRSIEYNISTLPGIERRLLGIQRNFDINNTIYTYLLEKRAEAGIARASNVSDNKPIDRADKYNIIKVKPKERRNYMIALILGLTIPGILILLIDFFNNKVIDRKDVERGTRAPVLGYISHNDFKTEVPVLTRPNSTLAESFRSVRTALKYFLTDNEHPVISISSTVSAEGKTFISINLSVISAMLGKKVLLLGLDLRKPKIHRVFNIDNSIGMSNYLSGEITFKDVIKKTSVENLYYAPSGPVPPNPAELIESSRMGEFLKEARKEFEYIFIDTPPVAIVTDALLLAPYVDINMFVVRQRYSSKNTLQLIEEFYRAKNLKNLSVIINDISLTGYYGYGLRYGYRLGYGGYSYGYNFYGDYVSSIYGYGKENKGYYNDNDAEET